MIKKVFAASVATGGLLLASAGTTVADTGAEGAAVGSPGVVSGNLIQVPIHIPVNVCGNTGNLVGVLNPAFGNKCANVGGHHHGHGKGRPLAKGVAAKSPGVLSGNLAQFPVHVPVNACGNSVDVIGALNPAAGNDCVNVEPHARHHHHSQKHHKPQQRPDKPSHHHRAMVPPVKTPKVGHHPQHDAASPARPELARTGAEKLGLAIPASAGLMLGGILLYRRGRRAAAQN
ncbi:chaplin [Streptomyces sp. NPDC050636]|uniref:chaplin n=1 Tax=Streptomyces sp. NPDC050636 TaxID=3154510 RepID=UPI003413E081